MVEAVRTEQLLRQLRNAIAPFRKLSPQMVMATGPTVGRTRHEQIALAEGCVRDAYNMLVEIQFFLSEYDDPDRQDDEEDDTTTPNPEEDEDECE
jgi:hypothetical protein